MNAAQRAHYFRDLWPAACRVQGWDAKDEAMRRDVTLEATGKASTSKLTELEITRLFDFLKLLADPLSIRKAMPVANPEVAQEEDACRRLVWVIEQELMPARPAQPATPFVRAHAAQPAFADAYVARCALGLCRAARVDGWRELPSASLEKLRYTLTTRRRQQSPDYAERETPYHRRKSTRRKRAAAREPQVLPRPGVAVLVGVPDADDEDPF